MREYFKYIIGFYMCMFLYADCETWSTESDCIAADHCEWHADEMACEDEVHCDDFTTEADCATDDHCEWDADEALCEDEGHDHDHAHCEDFSTEADCDAQGDACEWHIHDGEGECEDAGVHCEDYLTEADCEAQGDACEWHEHGGENVCEDAGGDCDSEAHANVDGLIIEHDGVEIYRQFQGFVEGALEVPVEYTKDLSVHFLDQNQEEIDFSPADCYPVQFINYDMNIISIAMEGDDHDDHDHGDEEHAEGHVFELSGLATGFTTFQIEVWHDGHADYTSMEIPVTVIEEVHCDDFVTEADCLENSEYCEWHADEGACEDEGDDHDHAHCEDFTTEADCDAGDHCEWHDGVCEDEEHHDDCVGLDGDVNGDSLINVLDLTSIIAVILGNDSWGDECQAIYADFNDDGSVNITDLVSMVQFIVNGRINNYATSVEFHKSNSGVNYVADGFVGAIQMTLTHNEDFMIDITDNAMVSDYNTTGRSTTIIIVCPKDNELFSSVGYYDIESVYASSEDGYVDTEIYAPLEFAVSSAYPNPFNPSTMFTIELAVDANVSVKVFNVTGKLVDVISEGRFSSGRHAFNWDASLASSGVYFINTVIGNSVSTQKVLLVK